jgi:flavin-dependent dehydrogenase
MTPAHPDPPTAQHDVVIMGGGLAGLTLALQLRQRLPQLDVLVLERRPHPVPAAAYKVGESTVEIGAHYFAEVLGLKEHLQQDQLKKFGFRFFFSEGRRDIENVLEIGASRPLPTGSWQIDRGLFENFLGQEVQRRGVRFADDAVVRGFTLAEGNGPHEVVWQRGLQPERPEHRVRCRWLIDASGRAGLVKRRLGLARDNAHAAHAVWFRIGSRIEVDAWSADPAWRARCTTPTRWLSTNHLVGAGYWVWLIPLASGSHSVGIVADPRWHPLETMNTFERAMEWLAKHQPLVFDAIDGRRDQLQDFAFFRRFSYDCAQVFSAGRWALAGEAGRFLDPFYSPGSDFIAIGNTYITELVARESAGRPIAAHAQVFEQIFRSFYDSTLALYVDQYGIFGSPQALPAKIMWDYAYYWSVLAPLVFQGRLADLASLAHLRDELAALQRLNLDVQALLRRWAADGTGTPAEARMLDQASLPWFVELNRALQDRPDDATFRSTMKAATQRLHRLAREIEARARGEEPAGADAPMLFPARAAAGAPATPGTAAARADGAPAAAAA